MPDRFGDITKRQKSVERMAQTSALAGGTRKGGVWDLDFDWKCENPVKIYAASPFINGQRGYEIASTAPCRKCPSCQQIAQMRWRDKMLTELRKHHFNYFVTLTFSDPHLAGCIMEATTLGKKLEQCCYQHVSLYFKRLRKGRTKRVADRDKNRTLGRKRQVFDPLKFRYVAIFEEGEKTRRPHFHLLLHSDRWVPTDLLETEWRSRADAQLVRSHEGSASYVSKYLTKQLGGRVRPSLGYGTP